jgi:hypothetical protein
MGDGTLAAAAAALLLLLLLLKTHANDTSDVIITAPQELGHFHAPLHTHYY